MSWRASDFPDGQAGSSGRGSASSGRDSEQTSDWHPERLLSFDWRKVILFTAVLAIIAASALWLATREPSGPSLAANPTPDSSDAGWEKAVPSPTPSPSRSTPKSTPKPPKSDKSSPSPKVTGTEKPRAEEPRTKKPRAETGTTPPDTDSPAGSSPPQLTVKEAYGIHGRYQRGLSVAQGRNDQAAMAKLEHGLALEMTRAGFKTAEMEKKSLASGIWPNPQMWIPRHVTGTADWFVAVSYEPGVARVVDVMSSAPGGWRLVASAADTRATPARFPKIATDSEGYATSLPENAIGLSATPRQIARAHLASLENAEVDVRFDEGPWTSEAALFWQQERAQLEQADWKLTLSYRLEGPVRALRTSDGGALVWYGARSTEMRKAERKGATVKLKGSAAVRTRGKAFANSVSATYGRMYVTYVPPAGSNEPARVLGEWSDVLESHGD
ncbi:hypothetical protein OG884_15900 [Streptosporangium sp. NBC_01755]|uniref:hypothetical protein n=1 Tax=unclassified Streptosporangium TaxID=2632669 RepID=UPI002DDC0A73|nr:MULTISPECIES: hypothetical protein [unclassified Streptosporangium]WSA25369.1 hypothetical protein OIE13_31335 [Streptosporangium sp. NBC_01810]WSD03315.1 hypothetical protein OG884_15900 [Streptosporangium sp. NBC_01755]